jgi:hypothetical protein
MKHFVPIILIIYSETYIPTLYSKINHYYTTPQRFDYPNQTVHELANTRHKNRQFNYFTVQQSLLLLSLRFLSYTSNTNCKTLELENNSR